jgi:hypothetical protein
MRLGFEFKWSLTIAHKKSFDRAPRPDLDLSSDPNGCVLCNKETRTNFHFNRKGQMHFPVFALWQGS